MNTQVKAQIEEALYQQLAIKAYRSFYDFFLIFWGVLYPTTPLKANFHIKYLCDEAQLVVENLVPRNPKLHDLLISIAPGETKSTIFSRMLPVWVWLRDPTIRIITGSHSIDLGLSLTVDSRDIIQSELYQNILNALKALKEKPEYEEELKDFKYFKLKGDQNVKSYYKNNQGGFRKATSATSKIYGFHGDLNILDDTIEPPDPSKGIGLDQADVAAGIAFVGKISTRKTDKKTTVSIYVQQRVAKKDVSNSILVTHKKLKHIRLPMTNAAPIEPIELAQYYDKETGYMNPLTTSPEIIEELIRKLTKDGFEAQCQQDPTDTVSSIWRRDWLSQRYRLKDLPPEAIFHTVTDTASTERAHNSPTGMLSYAYYEGKYYVRLFNAVWKKEPALYADYLQFLLTTGYNTTQSRAEVEPKANGISFVNNLRNKDTFNMVKEALSNQIKKGRRPPSLQKQLDQVEALNLMPFENVEIGEKPSNTAKGSTPVRFLSMSKMDKARHVAPVIESGRVILLAEDEMSQLYGTDWEALLTAAEDFPNTHVKEVIDLISYMIVRHETPLKERFYERIKAIDFGYLFEEGNAAPKPSAPMIVFWHIEGVEAQAVVGKLLYEEENKKMYLVLFDQYNSNSINQTAQALQSAYHDQKSYAQHHHLKAGSPEQLQIRRIFQRTSTLSFDSIFAQAPKTQLLASTKSKRSEQLENYRPFINALLDGNFRLKTGSRAGWSLQVVADIEAQGIIEAFNSLHLDLSNVEAHGKILNNICMGIGNVLEAERMAF